MLDAAAADPALDGIFKDAGRYVAALCAVYLHASGGLTLPRLKAMCAAFGLLSLGRARALLLYLRYLRYVEPSGERRRGSPGLYTPTAAFMRAWKLHLRIALEAARIIEPEVDHVINALHRPDVADAIMRRQGDGLMQAAQTLPTVDAYVRVFLNRHAGTQIASFLMCSNADDVFPPAGPIPVSISALAQRFHVSRIHVKRLLRDAEREGLLAWLDRTTICFTDAARAMVRFVYAEQLIRLLDVAAHATVQWPDLLYPPRDDQRGLSHPAAERPSWPPETLIPPGR